MYITIFFSKHLKCFYSLDKFMIFNKTLDSRKELTVAAETCPFRPRLSIQYTCIYDC